MTPAELTELQPQDFPELRDALARSKDRRDPYPTWAAYDTLAAEHDRILAENARLREDVASANDDNAGLTSLLIELRAERARLREGLARLVDELNRYGGVGPGALYAARALLSELEGKTP